MELTVARSRAFVPRGCAVGSAAALLAAALAAPTVAQSPPVGWATLSARLDVDLRAGDGTAVVDVRYVLAASEPDAPIPEDTPIDLELLSFGGATVDHVDVGRDHVVLWPTVGSHRAATIAPPFPVEGDTLALSFTYRVHGAVVSGGATGAEGATGPEGGTGAEGAIGDDEVAVRARVPILAGPAVLTNAGGPAFEARVTVPEGWALSEGFPSGLRQTADGSYAVSLPVVPAMLSFHARTDGSWRPGFPLLIDILTVLILAVFAGFGWRHLRSVAR